MIIKRVTEKEKKKADKFEKREWRRFNKEKGYKFKEKKYTFIVKENNKILGYIFFKINGGAAYLYSLIISKKARGKGIGNLLLKKFEETAKKKKCHIAYLETSERHKSIDFYIKHNYKIEAKIKNKEFHFTWYYLTKNL